MQSSRVPKSSSTASATGTSVTASRVSQPQLAAGQRQQGSFVGLSTTIHTPESELIPATYHQQDELGLLSSEIGTTQIAPFEALATQLATTFDDDDQGQSASSLSLSDEPSRSQKTSQPVDNVPIVREEPSPDPTDKWIILTGDKNCPFKCGYEGCGRIYGTKQGLKRHIVNKNSKHIRDSDFRCYFGDCAGEIRYSCNQALTLHIHANHTFEQIFGCKLCGRRFRRKDHLNYHMEHVHFIKSKKKSQKKHSVSESSSATTTIHSASTSTLTFRVSQPELAAEQHQQGSFIGLSATVHTPESMLIPETYHQQDELGLLSDMSVSDISSSQVDPFEILATHQTVTFADQDKFQEQEQLDEFPLPFDKLLQPVDDVPIVREEQIPDPNDKWIVMIDDKKKPFQCGYNGCGKKYSRKVSLQKHFVTHTGNSKLRCFLGECTGIVIYPETQSLTRHIHAFHSFERPFGCEICGRRFRLKHHLRYHRKHVHFSQEEKKSPKPQCVSKSSSATTTTHTASTSTMTFGVSQSGSAAEQRQQGSFVDLSKTVYTPEPTQILASHPKDELRLLSDDDLRFLSDLTDIEISKISTPHIDHFEILATHQTVTFEDQDQVQEQEQPDEFPLLFDELLQPGDDFDPMASENLNDVNLSILPNKNDQKIRNRATISIPEHEILPPNNEHFRQASTAVVPEAPLLGITGEPKLPSKQHQAYQRPDLTDNWVILTGDKKRPFKCGYGGCGRRYTRKHDLRRHVIKHTGDSHYKCYRGECDGRIGFLREQHLIWHIRSEHSLERPYQCDVCHKRFIRSDHLRRHSRDVHFLKNRIKSPKRKKK